MTSQLAPWPSRMTSALDAPELRCRAILVVGDCLAWNPVGDLAPARLSAERGWAGSPSSTAGPTSPLVPRSPTDRSRGPASSTPRRPSSSARCSTWARTTIGAQPWPLSRQATRRRTVIASIMNGPSPKSRPRPPRSSAATHWVECWSPRTGIGCTSPTPTPTTERSRVTYAWRSTRSEGSGRSRRSWGRSAHLCDTGTATTSTPPLPSSPSSLLAPA